MKLRLKTFLIPIILANPFQAYRANVLNEYDLTEFSLQSFSNNNFRSSDNIMPAILVRTGNISENWSVKNKLEDKSKRSESDTNFISGLKDTLFPKVGSSYVEKRKSQGGSSSQIERESTFRSRTTENRNGKERAPKGASDPTNPTNLRNFESWCTNRSYERLQKGAR
uniref:Uncharacterized protein n=1 Tax=Rhodogorgon sp. TaxID=2485824 RepID=A0A3G3MIE8_9FLOR|nr:hypothetical protein [Rhodogorgon sp.]